MKMYLVFVLSPSLKSDHFGIETHTWDKRQGIHDALKSDHFGIETLIRQLKV